MLKAEQMRRDRGLTITALAIASGLSDAVVSKVMRGALPPWPKYRNALARALEWTGDPMELFEEVGEDKAGFKLRGIGMGSSFGHSLYSKVRPYMDGRPLDVNVVFFKNTLSPSGLSFNFFILEEDGDMVHGGSYDLPHFWREDRIEWKLVEPKEDTNA